MKLESIERGNYYHIYNRGNNGAEVFFEPGNYLHFLRLYEKYLGLISETFAWCLMRNHFHFLIYFKEEKELGADAEIKPGVYKGPSRQLSHLFNSYTQAINNKFNRSGSLFERTFERKKIDSEDYLRKVIYYIHNNPVAHGVVQKIENYPWSSYRTLISQEPSNLKKEQVIELFGDLDNFIAYHKRGNGEN